MPDSPKYLNAYLQNDSRIMAVYRDEKGEFKQHQFPAEWVAYYESEELGEERTRMLRTTRYVRSIKTEGKWLRVVYSDRGARDAMLNDERSPFRSEGVRSYEGDVHPVARWLADGGIQVAAPRRAYLDIETDSRVNFDDAVAGAARVLAVAIVDDEGRKVCRVIDHDDDADEMQLLRWMWSVLESYDQVVAWNGDGFDFPILFARSRKLRLGVDANRWLWLDQMEAFRRLNMHAAESGEEKQSFSLENIGHAVVGKGKLLVPEWAKDVVGTRSMGAATYDLWKAGGKYRQLLVDYNVEDTDLLRAIEAETGYLKLFQTICEACGVFGNTRSLNPTVQMDGFMFRLGRTRQHHFVTREFRESPGQFKGAYVMQPRVHGIGRDVHVGDFKSLYPSIILTLNMSPDTKVAAPCNGPIPEGCCRSPKTGVVFRTGVEGILTVALRELIRLRDYWKKKKAPLPYGTEEWHAADRMSTAYKVVANSFYGVVGSSFSRFFDASIAESVTQTGVWLIKETIAAAENKGWKAVYSDTDSLLIQGCTEDEFREFVKTCNAELYPAILKALGCVTNEIKLAYEKAFERIVFCGAKRYIARVAHYEGTRATDESKPEIKGLEYKRGDALRMARTLQAEVIDMLVGRLGTCTDGGPVPTEDLSRYRSAIERARLKVLKEELPLDEVKLSKALAKPLREYAAKTKGDGTAAGQPPHVQVAHILKSRGQEVREKTRIEYIVTDGAISPMTVIPASDYTGFEADRYYLWESLVYPPTQRLLEAAFPPVDEQGRPVLDHDWERWAKVRPKAERKVLIGQEGFNFDRYATSGTDAEPNRDDTRVSSLVPDVQSKTEITSLAQVEILLGNRERERELHVVFVRGDDEAMIELELAIRQHPGDSQIAVVAWVEDDSERLSIGQFRYQVDFDAFVSDHHLRSLLDNLGARFAA